MNARSFSTRGATLSFALFIALGCGSAAKRSTTTGDDSNGGSGGETTGGGSGGSGDSTGGKGGSSGKGGSAGTGDTGGTGGSGTGGTGGSDTGGSGGSGGSDTGGAGGSAGSGDTGGAGGMSEMDAAPVTPSKDASPSGVPDGLGGPISMLNCDSPGLVWKTANKTNYTSYPAPGSSECITYSGCMYEGMFYHCGTQVHTKEWVMTHNIVAFYPFGQMGLHALCLKSGGKTIEVTVYDTCGDMDCGGCCKQNKGNKDALIDVESYTNKKWGVGDGAIQWADLGYKGATCN